MKKMLKKLVKREEGQSLVEYALIIALVAVALIVGLGAMCPCGRCPDCRPRRHEGRYQRYVRQHCGFAVSKPCANYGNYG